MLPIIQREVVEKRGWATEEEVMDYYAIGQCTPGVIAVNTSTFIGYKRAGVIANQEKAYRAERDGLTPQERGIEYEDGR